ncbi:hypothetical protein [Endozoicomonas lisbonensis]|uniref:Uncharacterized protein n=1 Tax=Endozoicomonas lisbonensis TaxID=3120522 RepID=A0ABV2SJI9_9GAMM
MGKVITDSSDVNTVSSLYNNSDYILDIQKVNWSFVYFPTDWNNYRVIYTSKLRLIDSRRSKVIAEGFCSRIPVESDSAPSYDELLKNKAEGLKKELELAARYCIQEFKTNVFEIEN